MCLSGVAIRGNEIKSVLLSKVSVFNPSISKSFLPVKSLLQAFASKHSSFFLLDQKETKIKAVEK
jgi:hypothetical protein